MCLTFFILPVSADYYDSRHLTSEEKTQLAIPYTGGDYVVTPDDTVIKLYIGTYIPYFDMQKDIISIIEKGTSRIKYMVISDSVEYPYYKSIYEGTGQTTMIPEYYRWEGFYTYTVSPNLVFDSSVKVNKIYCLDGFQDVPFDGGYIYYDTDHGEYVLFKEYAYAETTYLFPLLDFYEFSKLRYGKDVYKILDMEKYLFNDTPHAVPHPDTDNDEKCDACGCEIPENNDPFYHIPKMEIDNTTDGTEKIDDTIDGNEVTDVSAKPTDKSEETDVSAKSTDKSGETVVSQKAVDTSDAYDEATDKLEIGCSSSVTLSAAAFVGFIGVMFVFKKKRVKSNLKR